MRFRIEQMFLTDESGKATAEGRQAQFYMLDAVTPQEAISTFLDDDRAVLLGPIRTFPGMQATATAKRSHIVYTLQALPVTDGLPLRR